MAGSQHLMKYYLFALTFWFSPFTSSAQHNKVDSLLALLKTDKEDTNKVNHLIALGWLVMSSNPDSAIILSKQALLLSQKEKTKKHIANSFHHLGWANYAKGNYPEALENNIKSLKLREELNDKPGIAKSLGNIGIVYWNQGDYSKALDYYFKALKIDEELGNKAGIARHLGNIGLVYKDQSEYRKALETYFRALKIAEELGDRNSIANQLGNIGSVYHDQASEVFITKNVCDSLSKNAVDFYFKALKIAEELGDKNGIAIWLGNIGSLYIKTKRFAEAEEYLLNALHLCQEIGARNEQSQFEELLSDLYAKTNRFDHALKHYKRAMALKDSLFSEEKNQEITRKEMTFEFEKKEAVIKAEQSKKDAVTQIVIYSVSAGFGLVLLLAVFIFRGYRQKQRANIIISEQKVLVEIKQKDILDSIHYAKHIQQSLLPTEKYIEKSLMRLKRKDQ